MPFVENYRVFAAAMKGWNVAGAMGIFTRKAKIFGYAFSRLP